MPPIAEKQAQLGIVGLGVMGRNLALNLTDKGYSVAAWDANVVARDALLSEGKERDIQLAADMIDLVQRVQQPRRILVMVPAGKAVDAVIAALLPELSPGDAVIDGGNTWFEDTRRREALLAQHGIRFVGMGISGGEEGARHGPSLMPGGSEQAWSLIKQPFEAIAAVSDDGPCVTHVGADGSGHFVKMVHNGIEYGDMQLLAEGYDVLRRGLALETPRIQQYFAAMKDGPLASFLVELTAAVLAKTDTRTGRPLIELVADQAQQKGTGRWTLEAALALTVPIPTIGAAVDARALSSEPELRGRLAAWLPGPLHATDYGHEAAVLQDLHQALLAGKLCAYAQGFSLIGQAARNYDWNIDLAEIARIWKAGCIIRARILDDVVASYRLEPNLPHLFFSPSLRTLLSESLPGLRRTLARAVNGGIPVPALAASLAYIDSVRSAQLPQNLTQAQRDAFGAHTYRRVDDLAAGAQHSDWLTPDV